MLIDLLKEKNMTVYSCSKRSGIPYSTLLDIVNGKTNIEKCTIETALKLSNALGVDIEYLLQRNSLDEFESFKSNVKHEIKEKGDLRFIVETLMNDEIEKLWNSSQKAKAFYLLATLDYLSRINEYPPITAYSDIRKYTLSNTVKPSDIVLLENIDPKMAKKYQKDVIPEFLKFNIIERDLRDVA